MTFPAIVSHRPVNDACVLRSDAACFTTLKDALYGSLLVLAALTAPLQAQTNLVYTDADAINTQAAGGSPNPFYNTTQSAGNLWRLRTGFGFNVNGNSGIFEKDATYYADASPLETTVSGLVPDQEYGVFVCFLSPTSDFWQVMAGLPGDELTRFRRDSPEGRITDLGLSAVAGSNRHQYLGLVGNATADPAGRIVVNIDDGDGTTDSERTWYEGVAVGDPVVIPEPPEPPALPAGAVEVAPDGVWTWFNDERAIFHRGHFYVGYVDSEGYAGVTRFNPETGAATHMKLSTSRSRERDDHDNPSLTVLPDGRLLAIYCKHSTLQEFYRRISTVPEPSGIADWSDEIVQSTAPSPISYSNTYRLSAESDKIYSFSRAINYNPSFMVSTDNGATFGALQQLIDTGSGATRPYPRCCSNSVDRIDLIYTDGHPRNEANNIYHMFYRDGAFRRSDGTVIRTSASLPIDHDAGERGTVVYPYTARNWSTGEGPDDFIPYGRAWTWDIHYGPGNEVICLFQVQVDSASGAGSAGDRIYYYYARWDGSAWTRHFFAQGGAPLYAAEDDYGGGISLDPTDPRVVYISTNAAQPFDLSSHTDVPLSANNRYEIYRGFTSDHGTSFNWTTLTENSEADNLRPIVPTNHGRSEAVIWFYGTYTTYQDFDARVIGRFGDKSTSFLDHHHASDYSGFNDDSDLDGAADGLEYVFGTDAADPGSAPRAGMSHQSFSASFNPQATDVEVLVENSTDLSEWFPAALVRMGVLPDDAYDGFRISNDGDATTVVTPETGNAPNLFYRAKAIVVAKPVPPN